MTAPVQAALLGSGLFATNSYLPALIQVQNLRITHIWSRSESSVAQLQAKASALSLSPAPEAKHGPSGLDEILSNPEIKAVVMVLPIGVQPDVIRRCWKAGKHVISEKPVGRDVAEARLLIGDYGEYRDKLVWRVAENYAHEPLLHYPASLLSTPGVGDILTYRMHFATMLPDGSSYHGTTWRTVPDYQGGFLLDGGVHWAALLRTVLPKRYKPAGVVAFKSLHRAHMVPHDTLVGVVLPPKEATVPPHGERTGVKEARAVEEMPVPMGESTPHGSFTLTWAMPDTPRDTRVENELYIVCENATVRIVNHGRAWTVGLIPGDGAAVQAQERRGDVSGVERELADFAAAITAREAGGVEERNDGRPEDALWDVAFIQAALGSDGRVVDIEGVLRE